MKTRNGYKVLLRKALGKQLLQRREDNEKVTIRWRSGIQGVKTGGVWTWPAIMYDG